MHVPIPPADTTPERRDTNRGAPPHANGVSVPAIAAISSCRNAETLGFMLLACSGSAFGGGFPPRHRPFPPRGALFPFLAGRNRRSFSLCWPRCRPPHRPPTESSPRCGEDPLLQRLAQSQDDDSYLTTHVLTQSRLKERRRKDSSLWQRPAFEKAFRPVSTAAPPPAEPPPCHFTRFGACTTAETIWSNVLRYINWPSDLRRLGLDLASVVFLGSQRPLASPTALPHL
jgi:hypothetical protein